jgi:1-acyl-sn-glycerol-3-phosphate acyltransferase
LKDKLRWRERWQARFLLGTTKVEFMERQSDPPSPLALAWMKLLAHGVCRLYYRVLIHGSAPERRGGILFVGLHRNGAIDGWVHLTALGGDAVFLVGANLRRNPFTRPFAVGIAVERAKDAGDRSGNPAALEGALAYLRRGGDVFVYPEGTSSLGPSPLPFHLGAARIAAAAIARGIDLRVIPVGIDYAAPATPGSTVDVIVGPIVELPREDGASMLEAVHAAISRALIALAFVFADDKHQKDARAAAARAVNGDTRARAAALSRLALSAPHLATIAPSPASPRRWWRLVRRTGVAIGMTVNFPLFGGGWVVARAMADGPNVVALWRIVSGLFLAPIWLAVSLLASLSLLGPAGVLVPLVQVALGAYALRNAADAFGGAGASPVAPSLSRHAPSSGISR